jgi:hypothetical protein
MFEVTYKLKGISYVVSYKVEAATAEEARKVADACVKQEFSKNNVVKVTTKAVA